MLRNSAMPGSLYLISILHYIKLRIHFVSSMPPLLGKFRDAMADGLLELVRGLWLASPDLGPKPLLAKLREQQPDLEAGTREVREALTALKAESEAAKAAAAPPANEGVPPSADEPVLPAADEGDAPAHVAVSLACFGCARLPSDMDDEREKHSACEKCVKQKLPTTYWCGVNCPGNPRACKLHAAYHKGLKKHLKSVEDGGVRLQRNREVAEREARRAALTGDKFDELMAEATRYGAKEDFRRAARAYREAIALRPDDPTAYYNLGVALTNSGHIKEAAKRYLEAKVRWPVGSERWAMATASAFDKLRAEVCEEVAKPEWWNDEGLKALSVRVVRAAPNDLGANKMRAEVLGLLGGGPATWELGCRSAAELREAAAYFERAAAIELAPIHKAELASGAGWCRSRADAI